MCPPTPSPTYPPIYLFTYLHTHLFTYLPVIHKMLMFTNVWFTKYEIIALNELTTI